MAAKDIERAVETARVYAGCQGKVRIRDEQRLYDRLRRQAASVARKRKMDADDVLQQIVDEAHRRGPRCPIPGKDL